MERRVLEEMARLVSEGQPFAVVTLVDRKGSSPRDVGAKMLVLPNGSTIGTIGGGCVESGLVGEALEVLRMGQPKLTELDLVEEAKGGIGMECGGSVRAYIEPVFPPLKFLIIGGGNVGRELAYLAKRNGFLVTVVDPAVREDEIRDVKIIPKPVEEAVKEIEVDQNTIVIIASRHKGDEEALRAFASSPARYIGWLASRTRVQTTFDRLASDGVPREHLKRIRAPIGLDIGADTPSEIAVSIMAEIVKILRKPDATGKSLSEL